MVAVLDNGVGVVPHDDFARFGTDDGGDVAVAWPFDAADARPTMAEVFLSPCTTTSMASAVPRRRGVDGNDVAAADVGEDGAMVNQVGGNDDIDFVAFEQIDVA